MKATYLSLATLACMIFLTSCSYIPQIPDFTNTADKERADHWRARGKFSYRSSEATESGNFDWRQQGQNYQLRLFGPLGMGSIKISGNQNLVRIRTADQDISSDQPLSLLYRMTGFEIPLNSMPMWLTGKPASLSPSDVNLDNEGRAKSFFERKWQLSYSDYKEFGKEPDSPQIPTTVNAHKDGINLRMLIYTWKAE